MPGFIDIVELEFANGRGVCARENIEPDPRCGNSREAIHLLVSDGFGRRDSLPCMACPNIDGVLLNTLAVVQPLHGKRLVKSDRRREADFKHGMMRSSGSTP